MWAIKSGDAENYKEWGTAYELCDAINDSRFDGADLIQIRQSPSHESSEIILMVTHQCLVSQPYLNQYRFKLSPVNAQFLHPCSGIILSF